MMIHFFLGKAALIYAFVHRAMDAAHRGKTTGQGEDELC